MRYFYLVLCIFVMFGCKKTPTGLQEESRAEIYALITLFESINSIEDLVQQQQNIKTRFIALVDVMIEVQKYQKKYNVTWPMTEDDLAMSDQLRYELHRILRLEGAKIIMEKCQHDALVKLGRAASSLSN